MRAKTYKSLLVLLLVLCVTRPVVIAHVPSFAGLSLLGVGGGGLASSSDATAEEAATGAVAVRGTGILAGVGVGAISAASPKIHSWVAMDVETGEWIGSSNCKSRPRSVASTIKLAVVNCALHAIRAGRLSLDEKLVVRGPNDQTSDGEKIGAVYTVRDAIYQTLYRSSNTAPNLLAIRLGGLSRLNRRLAEMGYSQTRYNYLSSKHRTEFERSPGSTALDMATVARQFYTTFRTVQGTGSGSAWYAFSHAKDLIKAEGHETLGGKIGSNSLSATNTGLFKVDGRVYAIVVFSEENGLVNDYYADTYLNQCTTRIARAIAAAGTGRLAAARTGTIG